MPDDAKRLYKVGGVAFILSGLLFLCRDVLDFMAGPPPSNGMEILVWVESGKFLLSLVSEVQFFATMALVPATIALYQSLADHGSSQGGNRLRNNCDDDPNHCHAAHYSWAADLPGLWHPC